MKRALLVFFFLCPFFFCFAQKFDPAQASKSLVRVVVTVNQKESKVLTGFIWKSPNQVVTSLHGMSRTGDIMVVYPGNAVRKMRIKQVLEKADLVLLEVSPGQPAPPSNLTPITQVNVANISFGSEVFALGYNSGAKGSSTRILKKGYVDPELLSNLIPDKDRRQIQSLGYPDLNMNILYVEGSLLPGYSGAPIFDTQGKLVGIGNGGLENGASNVSWIIPCRYLQELEASTATNLPQNLDKLNQLYSATSSINLGADDLGSIDKALDQQSTLFRPVKSREFEFYKTKNRSIVELTESSSNPSNVLKLNEEITKQFNISLDLNRIRFDIYEDIQNGVVVVVPEGLQLNVINRMTEEEALTVRFVDNDFTYLAYSVIKDDSNELNDLHMDDIIEFLEEEYFTVLARTFGISGFYVADDYSYIEEDYNSNRKTIHISATGAELVYSPMDGRQYGISTYITLLINQNKLILTSAVTAIPYDVLMNAAQFGINCMGSNSQGVDCKRFQDFYSAFTAAHLTTFAY